MFSRSYLLVSAISKFLHAFMLCVASLVHTYAHVAVLTVLEVKLWTHHHLSECVICFHVQSRVLFQDYGT